MPRIWTKRSRLRRRFRRRASEASKSARSERLPRSAIINERKEATMNDQSDRQYLCLVYHDDAKLEALSQRDMDALVAECVDWVDELERNGRHIYSAGLQSIRSATTLRSRNGKVSTTDGPFAET